MNSTVATDKVALITGASSGIGRATALTFAQNGIKVALVARRIEKLNSLKDEISRMGGEAECFGADVANEAEAREAVASALACFDRIDILVNNAGILRPGPIESQNSQEWRDTFNINLLAPMWMSQAVVAGMKSRGSGHIVNISSNAAKVNLGANLSSYSASKYGMTAFSSTLRREVAAHGIRVTIVEPGTTETDVADSIPNEEARQFIDSCVHQELAMKSEDIAASIYFAVSQPARVNVDEIWLTPTRQ
jgi:NADP-dependent 3-hydroxy acid dehydrogenase YdfG